MAEEGEMQSERPRYLVIQWISGHIDNQATPDWPTVNPAVIHKILAGILDTIYANVSKLATLLSPAQVAPLISHGLEDCLNLHVYALKIPLANDICTDGAAVTFWLHIRGLT